MAFDYISVAEAKAARGLRMVVVGNTPSPWGEAAKSIFHLKRLPFSAVRLVYDDPELVEWSGSELSAPVVFHDDERRRSGWAEILDLAERLAPEPALLPDDPATRADALALAEKFCGPGGLGWARRLQMVHAGLTRQGGFTERVAGYLGKKYGYDPARADDDAARVRALLREFGAVLRAHRRFGPYYLGDRLTVVDVYGATFTAMFMPLPENHCRMHPVSRAAFEWLDDDTRAAIDPLMLEHRDMMYARHLELPLSL